MNRIIIRLFYLSFFFFFILQSESQSLPQTINGMVFLDSNRNNIHDKGEPGVKGVCVSNGRDVVQTDARGRWQLPLGDEDGVFLIKPAYYASPVNDEMIPQHFRMYNEMAAKALQEPINFPLVKSPEKKKYSALLFGDPQARGLKEVNYIFHDVVEECMGTDAVFGVSLGDIVADNPQLLGEINKGIAQIGIPWYNVFGNHDNDRDAKTNREKDDTFGQFFGPSTYAFEYGQVVFISLNDIFFKPDWKYYPHFTDNQLAFVKNYLETVPSDKLIVLMMHAPITECDNRGKMFELIQDRKYTFSVSGHVHEQINAFVTKEMGWNGDSPHHHLVNATVCGNWWCGLQDETGIPHATMNDGVPNGYSIVTFDGNTYSVRFKAARRPAGYQMNIYLPDEICIFQLDTTNVLVNVFAGSERSTVEMQVDHNENWVPLIQTKTIDPECFRMFRLNRYLDIKVDSLELGDVLGYQMDYPSESTHMWKGKIPVGLEPGTHTITVRTTDMFEQSWKSCRIFGLSPK